MIERETSCNHANRNFSALSVILRINDISRGSSDCNRDNSGDSVILRNQTKKYYRNLSYFSYFGNPSLFIKIGFLFLLDSVSILFQDAKVSFFYNWFCLYYFYTIENGYCSSIPSPKGGPAYQKIVTESRRILVHDQVIFRSTDRV
jgi:hypothetical protein